MELWKGVMTFHDSRDQVTSYDDLPEEEIYPMYAPANNLVDVALGEAPNGSPAELGLFAMQVIEAACRSVDGNANVSVAQL